MFKIYTFGKKPNFLMIMLLAISGLAILAVVAILFLILLPIIILVGIGFAIWLYFKLRKI